MSVVASCIYSAANDLMCSNLNSDTFESDAPTMDFFLNIMYLISR